MNRRLARTYLWAVVAVSVAVLEHSPALAETMEPLPYPERILALKPPIVAAVRYGAPIERKYMNEIVWGPEKAPGLFAKRVSGSVKVRPSGTGPVIEVARGKTAFVYGPKQEEQPDDGRIVAEIGEIGGFRRIELHLAGLDSSAHRAQFDLMGPALVDTGRIPPFQRMTSRTGPGDSAGSAQRRREHDARSELLEAMQPLLGFVLDFPENGVHSGSRMTVLRRDLGDLFRDAGPIPIRVEGETVGMSEIAGRRYVVLRLNKAELAPPMRANVEGYALIDIETALPETIMATIELIVLHGTDTSVFRFVERRVLLPEQDGG